MFSFRYTSDVCKHKKTILLLRMGQKLSSKLLFISSPNNDGFYRFYTSQGSLTSQLRCGGMFSNHFITKFPQNAPVKKKLKICKYLATIWTRVCGLLFWATLYSEISLEYYYTSEKWQFLKTVSGHLPHFVVKNYPRNGLE